MHAFSARAGNTPRSTATSFIFPLAALTLLILASCSSPPPRFVRGQWWVIWQAERPVDVQDEGVTWEPRKTGGEDEWVYFPSAVLRLLDTAAWNPPGTFLKVQVGNDWWELNRKETTVVATAPWSTISRVYYIGGQRVDYADWGFWLVVGGAGVAFSFLLMVIVARDLLSARAASLASAEDREKLARENLKKERAKTGEISDELEEARRALTDQKRQAAQLIKQIRQEEQEKAAASRNELVKLYGEPAPATAEAVDGFLKQLVFSGASSGEVITAKYLANPSGIVGLEWVIHGPYTQDSRVFVKLDGETIATDCGREGRFVHQLQRRGRMYKFTFDVWSGGRQKTEDAMLTVRIPTEKQWSRTADGGAAKFDKAAAGFWKSQDRLMKFRRDTEQRIADSKLDDEQKELMRADLESFLMSQTSEVPPAGG